MTKTVLKTAEPKGLERSTRSRSAAVWKAVIGYEGLYEVSSAGEVRNARTLRVLKPSKVKASGYQSKRRKVTLYVDRKQRTWQVHTLVATAFLGPRPDGCEINHIDGRPWNNAAANLEYTSTVENVRHARRLGLFEEADAWSRTQPAGADAPKARFTWSDVADMRERATKGVSRAQLMQEYKISKGHLSEILNRRIYKNPPVGEMAER